MIFIAVLAGPLGKRDPIPGAITEITGERGRSSRDSGIDP
jgi:hypothetical protein